MKAKQGKLLATDWKFCLKISFEKNKEYYSRLLQASRRGGIIYVYLLV